MQQNKEPRNKPKHIQSTDLQQGCQEYTMEKVSPSIVSSTNSVGKTGYPHAKE